MKFTYTFDQLRDIEENQHLRYMNYQWSVENYGPIDQNRYFTADYGVIEADSEKAACEKLFHMYNSDAMPAGYTGRCMSVSDIVNLWDYENEDAPKTSWFCDSFGFVKLEAPEEEDHERR